MRIAFVGKGGSGKTTLSALFSLYMDTCGFRVGLVDVDVNSHTASVLGLSRRPEIDLSHSSSARDIRQYLSGDNPSVRPDEFLNSTPPGTGSNFFTLDNDNYVLQRYGHAFGKTAHLFTAGSYSEESIGVDCHHSAQYIAENLLSHARLAKNDIAVVDAVAGNDIFGNSLYLQDMLVFIVKPEREGVDVFNRFYGLAQKAGISERVYALGNQVVSPRQRQFLEQAIDPTKLLGILPLNEDVVDARLDGTALRVDLLSDVERTAFDAVARRLEAHALPPRYYYEAITTLHRKLAGEGWVVGSYRPNMENQIDELFDVESAL